MKKGKAKHQNDYSLLNDISYRFDHFLDREKQTFRENKEFIS